MLEGGRDCAGTSVVLFLLRGAEPAWGVPVGTGTDWKSQFCHWKGEVQVKERTDAGCLKVIFRSLGSQSPVQCPCPSCELCPTVQHHGGNSSACSSLLVTTCTATPCCV